MKAKSVIFAFVTLSPVLALAQATGNTCASGGGFENFTAVICYVMDILNIVLPILFALAFIVFFWGLSKFILNSSGAPAEITKGKNYMMWGILALFVLVSARALITMVIKDLEIGDKTQNGTVLPYLPGGKK